MNHILHPHSVKGNAWSAPLHQRKWVWHLPAGLTPDGDDLFYYNLYLALALGEEEHYKSDHIHPHKLFSVLSKQEKRNPHSYRVSGLNMAFENFKDSCRKDGLAYTYACFVRYSHQPPSGAAWPEESTNEDREKVISAVQNATATLAKFFCQKTAIRAVQNFLMHSSNGNGKSRTAAKALYKRMYLLYAHASAFHKIAIYSIPGLQATMSGATADDSGPLAQDSTTVVRFRHSRTDKSGTHRPLGNEPPRSAMVAQSVKQGRPDPGPGPSMSITPGGSSFIGKDGRQSHNNMQLTTTAPKHLKKLSSALSLNVPNSLLGKLMQKTLAARLYT